MGINPIHHSIQPTLRRRPKNMKRAKMDSEQRAIVDRLALEVFNDCIAVGVPLQLAISSVFLSGMQLASELAPPASNSGEGE